MSKYSELSVGNDTDNDTEDVVVLTPEQIDHTRKYHVRLDDSKRRVSYFAVEFLCLFYQSVNCKIKNLYLFNVACFSKFFFSCEPFCELVYL